MTRKMLIDAAHPEETRVVVLDGSRVEEFDFESQSRKQLRGNIYLAKVIRVEPSLQAAFVEYGGNRHGFLAFNEIHPDYYQIPHADREALMREAAEADDDDAQPAPAPAANADGESDAIGGVEDEVDLDEEIERRRRRILKRYKIQEVIRRRQIMLVQVVKEERGNKGAALTTYLSLAGRYCVLMPNTDRGGGISRKIATATDRKRLRGVVQSLEVPPGMGLIVRTAGAKRTKAEIKRDYDYLVRAWDEIRETTLHSIAPALIYEEEGLVKRAIRDLFDKDIDGIWVEGEDGYKEARDFMRMLMPAQAKKVQPYREPVPLFVRHRVEDHLSQIYSPVSPLKSGGYLVINQTEALVSIDVNSGRATRERNIEATALKTNLEAAEEACRQLRLRDLAGLIVIDFIDMEEAKNNRAVEKKLKDCLKDDRARIQVGKISSFGLLELSRQRRRTGILEGTTHVCPHCQGAGRVRSVESSAITALRAVELEGLRGGGEILLRVPQDVGLYILNAKRDHLVRLRQTHGLLVNVALDSALAAAEHAIDRLTSEAPPTRSFEAPQPGALTQAEAEDELAIELDEDEAEEPDEIEEDDLADAGAGAASEPGGAPQSDDSDRRGGRRRRRRRGRRGEEERQAPVAPAPVASGDAAAQELDGEGRRRRRRGRRGGRRGREDGRPADVYDWAWPARAQGDDAYQWRGPSQAAPGPQETLDSPGAPGAPEIDAPPAAGVAMATVTAPAATLARDEAAPEVWVELPSEDEAAARSRRPRRRRKADERPTSAEPQLAPPDGQPDEKPAAAVGSRSEPHPQPAPEPESAAGQAATHEPAPIALAGEPMGAPQPAPRPQRASPPAYAADEIVAPPSSPRRGWWRRGG